MKRIVLLSLLTLFGGTHCRLADVGCVAHDGSCNPLAGLLLYMPPDERCIKYLWGGEIQGCELSLTNTVTTFAGTAGVNGSADGIGTAATFDVPRDIATDGTYLYVVGNNQLIRKIHIATAEVSTVAGTVGATGSADGIGTAASFFTPYGITTDGEFLYVADTFNHLIRKVELATTQVSTMAGMQGSTGSADGIGTAASFNFPRKITTDGTNVYVADSFNNRIRRIDIATHEVTTMAGSGAGGSVDGIGTAATFGTPDAITTDIDHLYVGETGTHVFRKIIEKTTEVTTMAGSVSVSGSADGTGTAATFTTPYGVCSDGTNLYVGDTGNHLVRRMTLATREVTTLAGTAGATGSADGAGTAAAFDQPYGLTTDGTSLFVVDTNNHTIRKID